MHAVEAWFPKCSNYGAGGRGRPEVPTEIRDKFDFELKLLSDDTVDLAQIFMCRTSNDALSIPPGPESVYRL